MITRISINTALMFLTAVLLNISCQKSDFTEQLDLPAGIICQQAETGTAMKGEKIVVSVVNVSEDTEITVTFGKEKILTRKGPGMISYAFETPGSKTITVSLDPAEIELTRFRIYVESLEDLQSLAARLKENPKLCLTMAHRGNSSDWSIPENSLSAIEKCVADKVDIFETDLYTTRDGVLVVSHDASLSRETNGSGKISNKTLSQIKKLYLKDRNGNVTTEKMLTFDEFLDACKGRIYINVDIGDRNADVVQVVNEVEKKGMTGQVLIFLNNKDKILTAFKANPYCNAYSNNWRAADLVQYGIPEYTYFTQCTWNPTTADSSRNGKVDSSKTPTDPANVAKAHELGTIITVNAIYTTNTSGFYPRNFTTAQVREIFNTYPSTQCIHSDTSAEVRRELKNFGRTLLND